MEIEKIYSCFLRSEGLTTDTRKITKGQMYLALKGPNFNGNAFAAQALEAGASFVVLDEKPDFQHPGILLVANGLEALQELAHHHRQVWGKPILAVCGSNGKTTTKELIFAALSSEKKIFSTPGNLNNHIGVPLCLLQLQEHHEMAIIEMGANHPGEIAELCRIANPDTGLITNVGKDHLEGFGTIENTAMANAELFDYLEEKGGLAFINTRDEWNLKLEHKISRRFRFPHSDDDFVCNLSSNGFFLSIEVPGFSPAETRLTGTYNFHNVAAALAISRYYGIGMKNALHAVCTYSPSNNRSQLIEKESNIIISDAYNANPSSVLAALENLLALKGDHKWALLGDMLELGPDSENEHALLGQWAKRHPQIQYVVVGPEMRAFASACPAALYFQNKPDFENYLEKNRINNALILLKGSRSMKMESAIPFL
jgi:UDP-N-acetylmuramoyl-tripeptide--D-alanyl-D-alanine ligase